MPGETGICCHRGLLGPGVRVSLAEALLAAAEFVDSPVSQGSVTNLSLFIPQFLAVPCIARLCIILLYSNSILNNFTNPFGSGQEIRQTDGGGEGWTEPSRSWAQGNSPGAVGDESRCSRATTSGLAGSVQPFQGHITKSSFIIAVIESNGVSHHLSLKLRAVPACRAQFWWDSPTLSHPPRCPSRIIWIMIWNFFNNMKVKSLNLCQFYKSFHTAPSEQKFPV